MPPVVGFPPSGCSGPWEGWWGGREGTFWDISGEEVEEEEIVQALEQGRGGSRNCCHILSPLSGSELYMDLLSCVPAK